MEGKKGRKEKRNEGRKREDKESKGIQIGRKKANSLFKEDMIMYIENRLPRIQDQQQQKTRTNE